jgi:ABC-type nitrate/sulfonate/bicarbonate transport system permease component
MWMRPYIGSTLLEHILASLYIVLFGWSVAALIGIPLGIAMAWWTKLKWVVFPIFQLIRPVPPLAWIPLTILWLGIGDVARMSVVFIAALVPWLMNSMLAVYSVDKQLIDAGRTLGASDRQILMRIVCRTALPTLVAGARMALGSAWSTLVAAEILAATAGLGYVAVNASQLLDTDVLLVAMFMIGLLGIGLTMVITLSQRFLAPWSVLGNRKG